MLPLTMQGIGIDIGSIVVLLLLFRSDWQVAPLELSCCALEVTFQYIQSNQYIVVADRHGRSRLQG